MGPVIIGNSTAAITAVEAIHRESPGTTSTLITEEASLPYSPMALLAIAEGALGKGEAFLRDADFFSLNRVEANLGNKAVGIDTAKRTVILEDGKCVEFSSLLIATGARPVLPQVPGLADAEVLTLRRVRDAERLRERMRGSRSACIIGAGFIGMEAAHTLLGRNVPTSVVEFMPQVLPGYLDGEAASVVQRVFEERGARFYLSVQGLSIRSPKGPGMSDICVDGKKAFSGDLLIVATGVSPRIELATGAGIQTDRGILVDDKMETSIPGIYAAGDVAQAPGFFTPETTLNPTLPAAAQQGRVAGINMAGGSERYAGNLRMNILNFFGRVAFSVGDLGEGAGDEVIVVRRDTDGYGKMILRSGMLKGCLFVQMPLEPGIIRAMVESREDFASSKERLREDLQTFSRIWMMKRRIQGVPERRKYSSLGRRRSSREWWSSTTT